MGRVLLDVALPVLLAEVGRHSAGDVRVPFGGGQGLVAGALGAAARGRHGGLTRTHGGLSLANPMCRFPSDRVAEGAIVAPGRSLRGFSRSGGWSWTWRPSSSPPSYVGVTRSGSGIG